MTAQALPAVATPKARHRSAISLKYLWCEMRRPFRRSTMLFNLALPAVLYLALFRTVHTAELPDGNFAMWMMIGIAAVSYTHLTLPTSDLV